MVAISLVLRFGLGCMYEHLACNCKVVYHILTHLLHPDLWKHMPTSAVMCGGSVVYGMTTQSLMSVTNSHLSCLPVA